MTPLDQAKIAAFAAQALIDNAKARARLEAADTLLVSILLCAGGTKEQAAQAMLAGHADVSGTP